MDGECGAEEKHSLQHTVISQNNLNAEYGIFFFTATVSIPVGLICCLEMFFA